MKKTWGYLKPYSQVYVRDDSVVDIRYYDGKGNEITIFEYWKDRLL